MNDPGLRRCGHCGAFDAWTGRQRRDDMGVGCIVIAHECGICLNWWRVPIPVNVTTTMAKEPGTDA